MICLIQISQKLLTKQENNNIINIGYILYNEVNKRLENFNIDFFELENGDCPIKDYLDSVDKKLRAKILWTIGLLETNGNMLGMPYSEHLDDGIFELRTKQGSDISRVLYFFCIGRKIILTHGFTKKTNKVPKSEIEIAKKYRDIYVSRQKGE